MEGYEQVRAREQLRQRGVRMQLGETNRRLSRIRWGCPDKRLGCIHLNRGDRWCGYDAAVCVRRSCCRLILSWTAWMRSRLGRLPHCCTRSKGVHQEEHREKYRNSEIECGLHRFALADSDARR